MFFGNKKEQSSYKKTSKVTLFGNWLRTPLGKNLINLEHEYVAQVIEQSHDTLLLVGNPVFKKNLKLSKARTKIVLQQEDKKLKTVSKGWLSLNSRFDKLPLATDSIDRVYLAHVLESSKNPHEILRECYRVLKPEGYVLISCFNSFSLWGLFRFIYGIFSKVPWRFHFKSAFKISDWLSLLGFNTIVKHFYNYNLPINSKFYLKKTSLLESIGRFFNLPFSASFLLVAYKRVIPLTPKPVRWRFSEPAADEAFEGDLIAPSTESRSSS